MTEYELARSLPSASSPLATIVTLITPSDVVHDSTAADGELDRVMRPPDADQPVEAPLTPLTAVISTSAPSVLSAFAPPAPASVSAPNSMV